MLEVLLVINTGSSSIKFSIFADKQKLNLLYRGEIESISDSPCLTIFDANHLKIVEQKILSTGTEAGLRVFFNWFERLPDSMKLKAVGHRVVHGGTYFSQPTLVTDEVMKKIASLIPFCPFHEAQSLEAIENIKTIYPAMPQVVCFDTNFHRTQEHLATLFAIPRKLTDEGLVRYGFHGISYEYIASVITQHIGDIGNKRVIVAHLGSGASMCAMHQRKSVATSMGLTALDGLMMGTRSGSIDPGLILYLLQEKKLSVEQVTTLLYQESGLLGVSGISNDMRKLQSSDEPHAIEAVDLFCFIAARELSALCGILHGCDAIIFTAGIGERSNVVRKKICDRLDWLGVVLDEKANSTNASVISQDRSKIKVGVIPTNEEYIIAKHTMNRVVGANN
ncbi:acetate/propionate family kinase [Legionella drozanskii]|uniref:acetate/propionate family kinase n=1 Tax=Legionella drozanskii TaxID=96228 RepID=UPI0010419B3C|nr:acetate/propionate family kinase [Legionella drozanskii]